MAGNLNEKDKYQNYQRYSSGFSFFCILYFVFCFLLWFYLIKYPQDVTFSSHGAVQNGGDILSLFDVNHDFMKNIEKNKSSVLQLSSDDKTKVCPYIKLTKDDAVIITNVNGKKDYLWSGSKNDLKISLQGLHRNVAVCEKLCATFMPSFFHRGTFCVHYDKSLKISGKDEPTFWF